MCGRTCMTLAPEQVKCSCKYKTKEDKESEPKYRNEYNLGRKYCNLNLPDPSYNSAPGDICQIIVSAKNFDDNADSSERVLIPALWGIVPKWHKGDYRKHGLTTNNARLEKLTSSKLYNPALESGRRCILVIEGFYEWQTVDSKLKSSQRPVYFIQMPQGESKAKDEIKLMFVAGLFDVWNDADGDSLYSFTVITYESDKHFDWLHHRTPAILETEDQISDWLDYERIPSKEALNVIKHPKSIVWYQVSNYVNSTKNKLEQCRKPIEDVKAESNKKNSLLSWINKRKNSEDDKNVTKLEDLEENSSKRLKQE
ncbi:CLUMA_CG017293, isoform A [Clunio marinus]|uniref:Abasic site processing protein HMCES n=1 Tax=Clunio marinus TaxID=568069 RepID=A0A1J1IWY3_9DIPT|nr:CLUMA_CG017293, isoform A [Clunio marinus]